MTSGIPFVSLKASNSVIEEEMLAAIDRVVRSGRYIQGEENRLLEETLTRHTGMKAAIPVSNGLDALRLILRAYMESGILKRGDEVIAPANTYIASVLPIAEMGLKTVLVKPDSRTYGLDWEEVKRAVSPNTRAVVTVHLYGNPSWDFETAQMLRSRGIKIIEDNAQAIGASVTDPVTGLNLPTGGLGDASAFSFYPTKNIGALGDAGAVCTSDTKLATTVRALANYGSTERYHNDFTGYNCRMDEIQAAVLNIKMGRLEEVTRQRRDTAQVYNRAISNPLIAKPDVLEGCTQVWHQYVIRTPERNHLREHLAKQGIATDIHYPVPLHRQKCFSGFGSDRLELFGSAAAEADRLSSEILSLPIANITHTQAEKIAAAINHFPHPRQ